MITIHLHFREKPFFSWEPGALDGLSDAALKLVTGQLLIDAAEEARKLKAGETEMVLFRYGIAIWARRTASGAELTIQEVQHDAA